MTLIVNAPSSHSYGAEFEARWRPISPLQLYGSLGLLRTKFGEFNTPNGDFTNKEPRGSSLHGCGRRHV